MSKQERTLSGIAATMAAIAVLLWLVHFVVSDHAPWLKYVWTAILGVGAVFLVASFVVRHRERRAKEVDGP